MIQLRELMGNYFIGYDDKVFKWDLPLFGILDMGVGIDEIIKSPILITKELLVEGFGFEPDNLNQRFSFGKFTFNNHNGWWYGSKKIPNQKYVHELQNIHFALTKQELKIKDVG